MLHSEFQLLSYSLLRQLDLHPLLLGLHCTLQETTPAVQSSDWGLSVSWTCAEADETCHVMQGAVNPPIVLVDGYNVMLQWVARVKQGHSLHGLPHLLPAGKTLDAIDEPLGFQQMRNRYPRCPPVCPCKACQVSAHRVCCPVLSIFKSCLGPCCAAMAPAYAICCCGDRSRCAHWLMCLLLSIASQAR